MHESNQATPSDPADPSLLPSTGVPASTEIPAPLETGPPPLGRSDERGLWAWLFIVVAAFVASVSFGQAELGFLTALGGMFAVAHAVDRDPRWTLLHNFLAWILPSAGALMFCGIAYYLWTIPLAPTEKWIGSGASVVATVFCVLLALRPVTDGLARLAFGDPDPGHVSRLGARMIAISFLLTIPGWLLVKGLTDSPDMDPFALGTGSLVGSVIGFTFLSLGAVGFLISRGLGATVTRLGLRRPGGRDLLFAGIGLAAILALNAAMEWVAQRFAPGAYARDQAMNELIAGDLSRTEMLLLGISAGVGEELSMRGALQPRFGLIGTSLLFAFLHVQYSPIGILTIAALGMILGAIRKRTSTTTAIAVHALYDIVAVISVRGGS